MQTDTLKQLAVNRKAITSEIHTENCFYGHGTILKRLADLPEHYQLKVAIQHGITYDYGFSEMHKNSLMPVFLCASEHHANNFENKLQGRKRAFAIGPMIKYIAPTPSPRAEDKKTLLVFPPHSAFSVKALFDHQKFAQLVQERGKDFDEVVICLHWRDVWHGVADVYTPYGFQCVTAGHIFDFDFLNRLAGYIQFSHGIFTSSTGSHILYSVLLNRPVWIEFSDHKYDSTNKKQLYTVNFDYLTYPNVQRAIQLFAEQRDHITSEQRQFIEDLTGAHLVKSGAELREIFDLAEELYQRELTPKRRLLGLARKGLYYQRRIVSAFNGGIVPIPLPED